MSFDDAARYATESMVLTGRIREMLAGKPAAMQGAILADLLAMWLAGHVEDPDNEGLRELVLAAHIEAVRALIPVNFKLFVEPQLKAKRH
jgi:hypothetical protein